MDAEKFTRKSLEVVENCEKLAYEYNNQEIDQEHLLYSLLTVDDSLIAKLLANMGVNVESFSKEAEKLVAYRPKVSGGKLFTSPDFSKATHIVSYGWSAVGMSLLAMFLYISALLCSHLAAFRVQTNM